MEDSKVTRNFVLNTAHDNISLIDILDLVIHKINTKLNFQFVYHGFQQPKEGISIKTYVEESKSFTIHFITNWDYEVVYAIVVADNHSTIISIKDIIAIHLAVVSPEELLGAANKAITKNIVIHLALSQVHTPFDKETATIVLESLKNDNNELRFGALEAAGILLWEELYKEVVFTYKNDLDEQIKKKAQAILEVYRGDDWVLVDLPNENQINALSEQELLQQVSAFETDKKYKQAIYLIERYKQYATYEKLLNALGILYVHTGNSEVARNFYNRALILNPHYAEAYFERGTTFLNVEPAKAIDDFKQVLAIKHDYWDALLNLGIAYFNQSAFSDSLHSFNRLVEACPHDNAYYCRGNVYLFTPNPDYRKSEQDYLKAIELIEKEPTGSISAYYVYNNLGLIYFNQAAHEQAIQYFNQSIEQDDSYATAYLNKANSLFALEQEDEAEENYEMSVNLSLSGLESMFAYGKFLFKQERYDEAFTYLDEVVALQPTNIEAKMLREEADIKVNEEFFE